MLAVLVWLKFKKKWTNARGKNLNLPVHKLSNLRAREEVESKTIVAQNQQEIVICYEVGKTYAMCAFEENSANEPKKQ